MSDPAQTTNRPPSEDSPDHPSREIVVEQLHRSFNGNEVLRGIDLVIERGEIVAIVGGSGCGKTVLLDHLIGHQSPQQGRVLIANHEEPGAPLADLAMLDEESADCIRIHWAVVFQHNALFSGTVYENIALWLREVKQLKEEHILPVVRRSLTAVELDPDTVMERDREDLSGGMAKRVAVARALAMDPLIMFYDEPTTGLDPHHAGQIQDLIGSTHQSPTESGIARTTVIITHDKDLLRRLRPRVLMLHEGRIFFDGPYEEFEQSDSPVVRPYFDLMPVLQRRITLQ